MIKNKRAVPLALSVLFHSLLALAIVKVSLNYALPETEVSSGSSVSVEVADNSAAKAKANVATDQSEVKVKAAPAPKAAPVVSKRSASKNTVKSSEPKSEPKFVPVKEPQDIIPAEKEKDDIPDAVVTPPPPKVEERAEEKPEEKIVEEPVATPAPVPVVAAKEEAPQEAQTQQNQADKDQPEQQAEDSNAAAAAQASGAQPVGTQGNPMDAEKLQEIAGNRKPKYPMISRIKREEGTVTLLAYIKKDGHVDLPIIQKSSGFDRLDKSAVESYTQWRYKPGTSGYVVKNFKFQIRQ
jgi:protein TonB